VADFTDQILLVLNRKNYQPLKPKALARQVGVPAARYASFQSSLRELIEQGRVELGKGKTVRVSRPHGTATGTYRRLASGLGFVRPHAVDGQIGPEIAIREDRSSDASTGDEVLVKLLRKPARPGANPAGEIVRVLERATRQFVGTYFERDGQGHVRVDGTVFAHSVFVGDPGARGARLGDKVVVEMLRFPSPEDRGEGVIAEVLGPHGKPGVDTLSIIREFGLPDAFPPAVLEEARAAAAAFDETELGLRQDFTGATIVTIDPPDAHDFDDAVSLTIDPKSKHWQLGVHIADVAHFVPPGGALDHEARKRGTSVYLPQRVLPMFPELISNGLASLQQGKVRFVKSVLMDFTPVGQRAHVRFAEAAIRVTRRFSYDQVQSILVAHAGSNEEPPREPTRLPSRKRGKSAQALPVAESVDSTAYSPPTTAEGDEVVALLLRMRELGMLLGKRRLKRGALELNMPETELEYDEKGRVTGAHFLRHDVSHRIIEEFMLAANEAVAEHLDGLDVAFLRRIHPAPEPTKLEAFASFARSLGYKVPRFVDRFTLQQVLEQSADKPDVHAVHYSLLRSLKQAVYRPIKEEHYALASSNYCHFTSPIRRYPDLTVHRQLGQWLRTRKAGADPTELSAIGEHCSKTERRADIAERELIKVKLLTYLESRLGLELEVVITGVADYGFFAQADKLPVEGRVHVSNLTDDYYWYDESTHSLLGQRRGKRYRLGDRVQVQVVRVDVQRRQLDFRLSEKQPAGKKRKGRKD
jgi:ribonuclease R